MSNDDTELDTEVDAPAPELDELHLDADGNPVPEDQRHGAPATLNGGHINASGQWVGP